MIEKIISKIHKPLNEDTIWDIIDNIDYDYSEFIDKYWFKNKDDVKGKLSHKIMDKFIDNGWVWTLLHNREFFDEKVFDKNLFLKIVNWWRFNTNTRKIPFMDSSLLTIFIHNDPDIIEIMAKQGNILTTTSGTKVQIDFDKIDPDKHEKIVEMMLKNYTLKNQVFSQVNKLKNVDFKKIIWKIDIDTIAWNLKGFYRLEQMSKGEKNVNIPNELNGLSEEMDLLLVWEYPVYRERSIRDVAIDNYIRDNDWICDVKFTHSGQKFIFAAVAGENNEPLKNAKLAILSVDKPYHRDIVSEYKKKYPMVQPLCGWSIDIDDDRVILSGKSQDYGWWDILKYIFWRENFKKILEDWIGNIIHKQYPEKSIILKDIPVPDNTPVRTHWRHG